MQLTITLPEAVHSLLAAHPKGAEAATLVAIKRYLKATASEGRDQSIADEAVRGATHAELANKYALSIPRIQQLVALGRDAALLRAPPKPTPTHTTTISKEEILREWSRPDPEPVRTTTTRIAEPIHNPAHDFEFSMKDITG
jgi:hypothetical protein